QDRSKILQHLRERIDEHDLPRERRKKSDRIDDRRGIEDQLKDELPHLADIAQPNEECGEDQRYSEYEDVQLQEQGHDEEPGESRADVVPRDEDDDDGTVDGEGDGGREGR